MTRTRPRLLVVSAVLPYPGEAGQQQRVSHKLSAFGELFETCFLTVLPKAAHAAARARLVEHADAAILLESRYGRHPATRLFHRATAALYAAASGLKTSNYLVGRLELTPRRVLDALAGERFDVAVFEYWHAHRAAAALRRSGVPTVLDMHDLLWRSRDRQLRARPRPEWWRRFRVGQYRRREEAAWEDFDALISINREEHEYVRARSQTRLFYAPMGVDLAAWPFTPEPATPLAAPLATPPRVAYYGGLGSPHNQRDARRVYEDVMPLVWARRPEIELWIIGSRPPADLVTLGERDARVRVTGFVDDVQAVLATQSLILCPWTGVYGFRSRLVQVMALGVPVVCSPDAVAGMDLADGEGLFRAADPAAMAERALALLADPALARDQGRRARHTVETHYGFAATYGRLALELREWLTS